MLAAAGVDRPAAQRFTDKPYVEIGSGDAELGECRLLRRRCRHRLLSFDSPAAKARADKVLDSDAWRKLSANRDNRVFAVNNEVWQTGERHRRRARHPRRSALGQRADQLTGLIRGPAWLRVFGHTHWRVGKLHR